MINLILAAYNFMLLVFLVPILLAIVLSGKKNRKDFFYCIKERLALWDIPKLDRNKKTVWLHCASLGEAKALEPMISYLQNYNVIISTITKSARQYVSCIKGVAYYALAPVDLYPFISSTVNKVKPDVLILIETEFWPGMIYCAKKTGAKIITVNGRISKTAFPYYKISSCFWKYFLNLIDSILVRNSMDFERFSKILKNTKNIKITGNIKYDRDFAKETISRESLFYKQDDLILTAGSTRDGEETILIDVFKKLKTKFMNLKLIIAPRHISRVKDICKMLDQKQIKFSLFSDLKNAFNDVLVLDVFGKLQTIYSISDIVFIGGSFATKGGQNPIEPAAYSKPVIFGRSMYNFENESELLKNNLGALQAKDENELKNIIDKLLSDKNYRITTGKNARQTVQAQKGAIQANADIIKSYLK